MIEKLKTINPYDETEIDMDTNSVAGLVYENTPLVQKINKLVDAVNILQAQVAILEEHAHPTAKTPVDPYAEQHKWIGKLCRFWDDNSKITKHFGILTRIDETAIVRYEAENGFWYCACEPVLPTDNAIYKGGNNE